MAVSVILTGRAENIFVLKLCAIGWQIIAHIQDMSFKSRLKHNLTK